MIKKCRFSDFEIFEIYQQLNGLTCQLEANTRNIPKKTEHSTQIEHQSNITRNTKKQPITEQTLSQEKII